MRKRLFHTVGLIALLVFAAGCGEDGREKPEVPEQQQELSETPIGFSGNRWNNDDPASRSAGDLTAANISRIWVYAHDTFTDKFTDVASSSQPDVMVNQLVERTGGAWTYAPLQYWRKFDDRGPKYMSFFAITHDPEAGSDLTLAGGNSYTGYPAFVVTPPTAPSQQKDIGVASAMDLTEADGSVSFTFNHAMAKVKFSAKYTSTLDFPLNVSIGKIELKDVYGSNTLRITDQSPGFRWDDFGADPAKANYTLSLTESTLRDVPLNPTSPTAVSTDAGTLMLVPQENPSDAKTKVTFYVEQIEMERETTQALSLAAGQSYDNVLTLNLAPVQVGAYAYTGSYQTFTVPQDGAYLLEVWGAKGGLLSSYTLKVAPPGNGGYAVGKRNFTAGTTLYIYVGGAGSTTGKTGGWNGGGTGTGDGNGSGGGGGGATDIRFDTTSPLTGVAGTDPRIIVAGGGGGGVGSNNNSALAPQGGPPHGGGLNGIQGGGLGGGGRAGGSQTAGYAPGQGGQDSSSSRWLAGGGGGWWGGHNGGYVSWGGGTGGGGSAFVGKVTDGVTCTGGQSMPDPANPGSTMSGNAGNGYARITLLAPLP